MIWKKKGEFSSVAQANGGLEKWKAVYTWRAAGPFQFAMINPIITKKSGAYQTEEGCLSLKGVRPCTRYQEIEVDYLDQNFKKQHGEYSGWTAQIIQHEIDHCNGIVI